MSWSVFDRLAARYDAWYDRPENRAVFESEARCVGALLGDLPRPWLEVGVGSGRFAERLGVDYGVDPSVEMLKIAASRGIKVFESTAESLPFPDASFGAVLFCATLCFVESPQIALAEAERVLFPGGGVVVGAVLRDSPWGRWYARKAEEGNPFYREARFLTREEIESMAEAAGLSPEAWLTTLTQPPGSGGYRVQDPIRGYRPDGGFHCLLARKPG